MLTLGVDGINLVEVNSDNEYLNYWMNEGSGWNLLINIGVSDVRPYLGFTLGSDGTRITVISKFEPPARPTLAMFNIVSFYRSSSVSSWSREEIVSIEGHEALRYGDRVVASEYDDQGVLHTLYLGPGNQLIDSAIGIVANDVDNALIRLERGSFSNLWLFYHKKNNLVLSKCEGGSQWTTKGKISGLSPDGRDGRYDLHIDSSGRKEATPNSARMVRSVRLGRAVLMVMLRAI